ncbi:MAG: RNA polymerase sigma factor [Opitutaceae bacterium]|nr:RNA polymerase sigma factor [Opitutaceae bacterium]
MAEPPAIPSDFTSFYRRTLAPLRRYLARLTGNAADAQEIAHDAYARVYPAMQEKDVGHPQAFLYTTARHLALDRIKRRTRAPFQESAAVGGDLAVSPSPGVESVVMAREEWALMQEAVAALPPGCRQVLLLRTVEHLSHEEIAQRLGLARSSVEKHLMRAVRLLQESLHRQTGGRDAIVQPINPRTGTSGR